MRYFWESTVDDTGVLDVPADDAVDSQKYLIFMAGHLKLGVVAEDVVEILNNQVITYLPMVPHYIRGIINMRGQMVPILDSSSWGIKSRSSPVTARSRPRCSPGMRAASNAKRTV